MMLVVAAVGAVGGFLLGHWAVRLRRRAKELAPATKDAPAPSAAGGTPEDGMLCPAMDWSLFPCALGDVVVRAIDGAEAWLAGAIVFREDAPAAVLFLAPDAAGDRAIYARPAPKTEIDWLSPVPAAEVIVGAEPPSAIELEGRRYERVRRLPLHVERLGTGVPDVGTSAIVGEYRAESGEVAVVLVGEGGAKAWKGRALSAPEYEVWQGGRETR
jgi:hypothetical protein